MKLVTFKFLNDEAKNCSLSVKEDETLSSIRRKILSKDEIFLFNNIKIEQESEESLKVCDIENKQTVDISTKEKLSTKREDITIKKEGCDSKIISFNIKEPLKKLHDKLLEIKYIVKEDSFNFKGNRLPEESFSNQTCNYLVENSIKIFPKDDIRDVIVKKGENKKTFKKNVTISLEDFKKDLLTDGFLSKNDKFIFKGSIVTDNLMNAPLKKFLEDNIITVVYKESKLKWDTKDPNFEQLDNPDLEYNLEAQKSGLDKPFPLDGDIVVSDKKDYFDTLEEEKKIHLLKRNSILNGYVIDEYGEEPSAYQLLFTSLGNINTRLPHYTVTTDKHATFNRLENALVKSGSKKTSGGINLGFFAFKKSDSSSKKEEQFRKEETFFSYVSYKVPKIVIQFDEREVTVRKSFVDEFYKISYFNDNDKKESSSLTYKKILRVFEKYGHFFYTQFTLGGCLYSTSEKKSSDIEDLHQEIQTHETGFSSRIQYENFSADGKLSMGNTNGEKSENKEFNEYMNLNINCIGGDENSYTVPNTWISTLASYINWRVIEKNKPVSTILLLPSEIQEKITKFFKDNPKIDSPFANLMGDIIENSENEKSQEELEDGRGGEF